MGSTQHLVVYEDMTTLCKMFCLEHLKKRLQALDASKTGGARKDDVEEEQATAGAKAPEEEEEEEQVDLDQKQG